MAGRSVVYALSAVIVTSHALATTAGLDAMRFGGNAIDAAVTAAAMLSLTEPHTTGVGGDLFAIIWLAREEKLVALNAAGRAGSLLTREKLAAHGFGEQLLAILLEPLEDLRGVFRGQASDHVSRLFERRVPDQIGDILGMYVAQPIADGLGVFVEQEVQRRRTGARLGGHGQAP